MSYTSNVDFSGFSASLFSYMRKVYPEILRKLRYSDTMSQFLTTVNTAEGVYQISNADISALIQGYQTALTAKGKVSPNAELVYIRRYKGDFPYDPVEFYDRWLSHIEENRLRPSEHPFESYVLNMILEKMVEDIQLNSAKGLYKDPVANVPTQSKHAFTGYLTELRRLIVEGKINPITTAAFTASTIRLYLEEFADNIDELYQGVQMNLLCSIKNSRLYSKDYREDFATGTSVDDSTRVMKMVFDTGMTLQGDSSLNGENIFIATPRTNLFRVNSIRNNKPIEAQRLGRVDWILQDGGIGFGFGLPAIVFVCGQVITPPSKLLAPAGALLAATTATIRWEEVPGATGYRIDVNTAADFTGTAILNNVAVAAAATATEVTLADGTVSREYLVSRALTGLTTATPYYFRIRAELNGGVSPHTSLNSAIGTFTTA